MYTIREYLYLPLVVQIAVCEGSIKHSPFRLADLAVFVLFTAIKKHKPRLCAFIAPQPHEGVGGILELISSW